MLFFEGARVGGARPYRERGVDSSRRRPGDVYLPGWSQGQPLAADVTISHPSQASLATPAREGDCASIRAAATAARDKVRKHQARCNAQGVEFLPLAVCSFGGWLPEGMEFVNALAARVAERTGLAHGTAVSQLWQRLSVTLWRANAQAILHSTATGYLGSWDLPAGTRAAKV